MSSASNFARPSSNVEIIHDPFKLPHRALLRVKSVDALEAFLQAFIRTKFERGYRLRVVPDVPTGTLELQSRRALDLQMALRAVREHFGPSVKKIHWKDLRYVLDAQPLPT